MVVAAGAGVEVTSRAGSEPAGSSLLASTNALGSGSKLRSESTSEGVSKALVATGSPLPLVSAIVNGCNTATLESSSRVASGEGSAFKVVSEVEPAGIVMPLSSAPGAGSAVGAGDGPTARPSPVDVVT